MMAGSLPGMAVARGSTISNSISALLLRKDGVPRIAASDRMTPASVSTAAASKLTLPAMSRVMASASTMLPGSAAGRSNL